MNDVCYQSGQDKACRALIVTKCTYPDCSFFCTCEQVEAARAKTAERLQTLDETEQLSIADKYYNGKLWWNK